MKGTSQSQQAPGYMRGQVPRLSDLPSQHKRTWNSNYRQDSLEGSSEGQTSARPDKDKPPCGDHWATAPHRCQRQAHHGAILTSGLSA